MLEAECFVQMKYMYRFWNFLSLKQRFLQYLHVQPSFYTNFLLGNDLHVGGIVMVRYKDASENTKLAGADIELLENQFHETGEKLQAVQGLLQ